MSEPFISEIKIMAFNFPPKGWALCNGQLLPINQNQALFSLLGTTYGGNGQTNFALPNLRGRVPIHTGDGHTLGEAAGSTSVTISQSQMPQHLHMLQGINETPAGNLANTLPTGKVFAQALVSQQGGATTPANFYEQPPTSLVAMAPQAVSNTGGSQPHDNMMPYLTLNFCIALQGIFPSRN